VLEQIDKMGMQRSSFIQGAVEVKGQREETLRKLYLKRPLIARGFAP